MKRIELLLLLFLIMSHSIIAYTGKSRPIEKSGLNERVIPAKKDTIAYAKPYYRPTKAETDFYNYLYEKVSEGNQDTIRSIFEHHDVNLKKFEDNPESFKRIIIAGVHSNNKEIVQELINRGAVVNSVEKGEDTALHIAAQKGNLDIVKMLVENGADLNAIYKANSGLSPLCIAILNYHIEVVEYLIGMGADVNYINENHSASVIQSAVKCGNYEVFCLVVDKLSVECDWTEVLISAIRGGNLDILKYIVEKKGAKVNEESKWGIYPLEVAANNKYHSNRIKNPVEIVRYLVDQGADLNKINKGNVFEWAMQKSDEATIEYMIEKGVNIVIAAQEDDWTPVAMALDNNNFAAARHLLRETTDHTFRYQPLIVYFADGKRDSHKIMDFLIKEGVNKEHYVEALFCCVMNNDSASTHLLLDGGADIKAINPEDGSNVLHLAHDYQIAKLLIKKGADVKNRVMLENAWKNLSLLRALNDINVRPPISKSSMGEALGDAARYGNLWAIKYLLNRGVDVNFTNDLSEKEKQANEKRMKVISETYQERPEHVELNMRPYKQTALMRNAMRGYSDFRLNGGFNSRKGQVSPEIAKILLDSGADPNIADSKGRTALHYAAEVQYGDNSKFDYSLGTRRDTENGAHADPATPPQQYHDSIAALLIKKGADINAKDKYGNTPLITAAIYNNGAVLKMLLDAGADIHIKNNKGNTFSDYVRQHESMNAIRSSGLTEYIKR